MTSDTEQLAALAFDDHVESSRDVAKESARGGLRTGGLPAYSRYLQRKYCAERILGCLLLVPAAPVILLVCLIVKLTSRGPALYRQVRLGHNRKSYEILKIRTMRLDAEADGIARWCVKQDPRITPLGRFLRKVHLDELPQLINVARGEMVLVGPRPERPQIAERLAEDIDGYYDRLSIKPGITGLAQINLPPDETLEDARRKQLLDLQYIREANHWLDFRMLAATGLRMCGISGDRVTKLMRLCRKSLLAELSFESDEVSMAAKLIQFPASISDSSADLGENCVSIDSGSSAQHRRITDYPRQPR